MKGRIAGVCAVLLVLLATGTFAEEPIQYKEGYNAVWDDILEVSYEKMSYLALAWQYEEREFSIYDIELDDAYSEEDVKHPHRVFIIYPTDSFDALYLWRQEGWDTKYENENTIAWQALWWVNMINETGQSHASVQFMSASMSTLSCETLSGFENTCYVAYQLTETSPCYITVLHAIDEVVLVYTTAIWSNSPDVMNNLQTLAYTLKSKYGPTAFDFIDATAHYQEENYDAHSGK